MPCALSKSAVRSDNCTEEFLTLLPSCTASVSCAGTQTNPMNARSRPSNPCCGCCRRWTSRWLPLRKLQPNLGWPPRKATVIYQGLMGSESQPDRQPCQSQYCCQETESTSAFASAHTGGMVCWNACLQTSKNRLPTDCSVTPSSLWIMTRFPRRDPSLKRPGKKRLSR